MEMPLSAIAMQSPAVATSFVNAKDLADLLGESPNHFDDLFKDLEDWEAILTALPNLGVDQNFNEREPPAPVMD